MMGLNFTNCNAIWSYSGFNHFREKLASEINIDLRSMQGYHDNGISWEGVHDDIKFLLNHSDCDGHLTPLQCKKISKRLKKLISKWPNYDYDKIQAKELCKGMDYCSKNNKKLLFR